MLTEMKASFVLYISGQQSSIYNLFTSPAIENISFKILQLVWLVYNFTDCIYIYPRVARVIFCTLASPVHSALFLYFHSHVLNCLKSYATQLPYVKLRAHSVSPANIFHLCNPFPRIPLASLVSFVVSWKWLIFSLLHGYFWTGAVISLSDYTKQWILLFILSMFSSYVFKI